MKPIDETPTANDLFYEALTEEQKSFISSRWDLAHSLVPWRDRERENRQIAETRARLKRWSGILAIAAIVWGLYCWHYYEAGGEAREKLAWIYQEGVKDRAVRSLLERVDQQRAEYHESFKD